MNQSNKKYKKIFRKTISIGAIVVTSAVLTAMLPKDLLIPDNISKEPKIKRFSILEQDVGVRDTHKYTPITRSREFKTVKVNRGAPMQEEITLTRKLASAPTPVTEKLPERVSVVAKVEVSTVLTIGEVKISEALIQANKKREDKIKAEQEMEDYLYEMIAQAEKDRKEREENPTPKPNRSAGNVKAIASKEVPNIDTSFKTYMDYRAIKNKSSTQYILQQSSGTMTNDEGFRMHNGEYMVAVGTYYAKSAGTRIRVTLSTGKQFDAIVGDIKADIHTDSKNQHRNGNVVEFIVDTKQLPQVARRGGDVSLAPLANLQGRVTAIEILSVPN